MMGNDNDLLETLRKIGDDVGERVWPMPLYEEYFSYIKSEWADMKNAGSRWGGAVTAGMFLKQFIPEKVSWAHLDVAGGLGQLIVADVFVASVAEPSVFSLAPATSSSTVEEGAGVLIG